MERPECQPILVFPALAIRIIPIVFLFLSANSNLFSQVDSVRTIYNQSYDRLGTTVKIGVPSRTSDGSDQSLWNSIEFVRSLIDSHENEKALHVSEKVLSSLYDARAKNWFLAEVWFQRGRALLNEGKYSDSEKALGAAIEIDDKSSYHLFAARNCSALPSCEDAIGQLEIALRLASAEQDSMRLAEIWFEKSTFEFAEKDTSSALAATRRALEFFPAHPLALARLRLIEESKLVDELDRKAMETFLQGDLSHAVEFYQEILKLNPEYPEIAEKLNSTLRLIRENEERDLRNNVIDFEREIGPVGPDNLLVGLDVGKPEAIRPDSIQKSLPENTGARFASPLAAIVASSLFLIVALLIYRRKVALTTNHPDTEPEAEKRTLDIKAPKPRYKRQQHLGSGGMGVVYLAFDTVLKRNVALKVIRLDPDETLRMRFLNEAMLTASLLHPNIVTIHDIVEEDNALSMVMEFISGETLRTILDANGWLPLDECCRIIIEVSSALKYAHLRGVIHRDIKPDNIMLSSDGELKVLDFGIAKPLNDDPGLTAHAGPGVPPGTPFYMSPEQIKGEEIDSRSDIFSAGTVFYELLTGRKPFDIDNSNSSALVFSAILTRVPEPPSAIRPELPREFDSILSHMMAKNRERRIQNMDVVIDTFKSFRP